MRVCVCVKNVRTVRMPPRGLKALVKKTAPGKLVGEGKFKGYQATDQGQKVGRKLKGITKRLHDRVFSDGTLPIIARRADHRPGGHWAGRNGGRTRGSKVDAQVTRIVNSGPSAMKQIQHTYKLTKLTFAALSAKKLEPVVAQRVVMARTKRLATAADIVCYDREHNQLVVVELKCGFDHGRRAPAELRDGKACTMKAPMSRVPDCNLNRHLCQLAVTRELFLRERRTMEQVAQLGVDTDVRGLLLYAADSGVELFELDEYWKKRAWKIACALG